MITLKYLTDKEFDENFDNYYKNWDVTYEGMDTSENNIKYLEDNILKNYMKNENIEVSVVKGKSFNNKMGLSGEDAYPDELNILIIKQEDLKDVNKFAVNERMMYGFRWFTDVVDNNRRRRDESVR